MKHLDLFSGIGGFALAASWVWGEEHEIVSFCEIEPFAQKVLKKHWPDVPIHGDVKTLKGNEFGPIDLISGGFPCQPYSVAGKRKGAEDDRALWPEMFRIIKEAKPRWIIGENVAGFVNMGLDDCLSDLESEDYETTAFIIPACAVNAPHRRDRVWIVANLNGGGPQKPGAELKTSRVRQFFQTSQNPVSSRNRRRDNGNPTGGERPGSHEKRPASHGSTTKRNHAWDEPWIEAATRFCGMDARVSNRVDRLKGLGNSIVPQVVVPIMEAIKDLTDEARN